MSEPEHGDKDQLWLEATQWFARMRSPDAEAFQPEFEQWLARGALHRRYYNRAAEYWVDSKAALSDRDVNETAGSGEQAGLGEEAGRPEEAAPGDIGPPEGARSDHRNSRSAVAALIALSFLVASSAILTVAHYRDRKPAAPLVAQVPTMLASARFATAAGEQRRVLLADGSAVLLGGATTLRMQFGTAIRRLVLDRGHARFEVAHEARPFVVFAGGGSVTAHGTMFDVGVTLDHRVSVRLIRGSVDVRLPPRPRSPVQPPARRLRPGESISFAAASEPVSGSATTNPAETVATTMPGSSRDYRDVRLGDIVAEANRDATVPIRFADPSTAEQKVSGRFRIDDSLLLAERLAALFDLVVDRSDPSAIVLRRK